MHAEVGAVHPREVEQVSDEPFETRGFEGDGCRGLAWIDRPVLQRLRVAADRSQGRLQLVADGQEEVALRLTRTRKLCGEVVEGRRKRCELGRPFDGDGVGKRPARETS